MLTTPLGDIIIKRNGRKIEFDALKQDFDPATQLTGISAQSYQIDVEFQDGDSISCALDSKAQLQQSTSVMGLCECKILFDGVSFLTIGCMEEINNCKCQSDGEEYEIGYHNLKKADIEKVSFAISWVG